MGVEARVAVGVLVGVGVGVAVGEGASVAVGATFATVSAGDAGAGSPASEHANPSRANAIVATVSNAILSNGITPFAPMVNHSALRNNRWFSC